MELGMTVRGVALDIGGVLLDGEQPLPGAAQALALLRAVGLPFVLLTNTTRSPHALLLERLAKAGLSIPPEALLTPAVAAREWLQHEGRRPLLLIHPSLRADFMGLNETAPDAVVVGDAGETFTYANLNAAFQRLMDGASLISLSGSRFFSEGGKLFLDAGPFIRLLEEAAGCQARCFGKPGLDFFLKAADQLGVPAETVMMIGDDVHSDVLGARKAGFKATLVRTGKYRQGDECVCPKDVNVAADVHDAVMQILTRC